MYKALLKLFCSPCGETPSVILILLFSAPGALCFSKSLNVKTKSTKSTHCTFKSWTQKHAQRGKDHDSTNAAHLCKETQNEPPVPYQVLEPSPSSSPPLEHAFAPVTEPSPSGSAPVERGLAQFQNPAHLPPLRCTAHQTNQCPNIIIAKPQRVTKCAVFTHHLC